LLHQKQSADRFSPTRLGTSVPDSAAVGLTERGRSD
jgi:hypothetical protein